jgi:hypothetical protein
MSVTAARASRLARRSCESCRERRARFQYRGQVRADRHHTLCFECFRRARERARARTFRLQGTLPLQPPAVLPPAVGPVPVLTARQRAHRQAMLSHILHTQAGSRGLCDDAVR